MKKDTYQQQVKEMEEIACFYFACKRNSLKNRLANSCNHSLSPDLFYINRVNDTYYSLTPEEQTIINNDFFYQSYPGWWMASFSKRLYEKNKRLAIKNFLEFFHETD